MGQKLTQAYPDAILPEVDIANQVSVNEALDRHAPDVVINAAGKTGRPNVDWCEDNKEATIRSNVLGPLVLLDACSKRGIYWVHFSTGCIYEGGPDQLFTEEDAPNFTGSYYSRTKGWTDQMLKEFPGVLQLRVRMPFDEEPGDRNLITKLTRYPKVLDVPNSISYIPDVVSVAQQLIAKRAEGIYNVVNPGAISPYEIMELYKEIVDPAHEFERLTLEDLPNEVKAGRSNCVLSTAKLEGEGINLMSAEEAVRSALEKYTT